MRDKSRSAWIRSGPLGLLHSPSYQSIPPDLIHFPLQKPQVFPHLKPGSIARGGHVVFLSVHTGCVDARLACVTSLQWQHLFNNTFFKVFFFQFGTKTRQIKIYLHLKNLLHRLTGYVIRIKWRTIIFVSHVAVLRCSWRWFNTYYVLRLKSGGKPDHQTLTYDSAASINLPGRYFDRNELLEIHQSDDWYVKLKVQHRLDEQGLRSFR